MALYIMERFSDGMLGEGERLYPKLVNGGVTGTERIAGMIERRTSFTRGDVVGLLAELADIVEGELASGNSVRIDGLGTLRPVLGLVGKELRGEWTDSANRLTTGRNVRLKTVNFRPDSGLLRGIGRDMTLERASNRLGRRQPSTTVEERAALARQYLSERGFMRVADYAALTGLARTTAANELRRLAEDETSGITSVGARAGKIYVLGSE